MVAGNSKEEAFVQGLSEILERYVIKRCILECLTPPNIDSNIFLKLENYSMVQANIKAIERSGRYQIEIKDLSLGTNILALAIVLYDKQENRYLVKAGVHPRIEIALERCFTELLQGQYIDNYYTMINIKDSIGDL